MIFTLASGSRADDRVSSSSTERLVNCYAVPSTGEMSDYVLRPVQGMRAFAPSTGLFHRASCVRREVLYTVAGGSLQRINKDGVVAHLASLPDDPNTTMAGHRNGVTIAADGNYYVWDGDNLTLPTGGALAEGEVGTVDFLRQYTLISELNGRRLEWSEVGQAEVRNGLNFAETEARDDDQMRVMRFGEYAYVFKRFSIEVFAIRGVPVAIPGSVYASGLRTRKAACLTNDGIFFVSRDRTACLIAGGPPQVVGTPAVNQSLKDNDATHCFFYQDRGNDMAVIRFSDRAAWVYNMTTGFWHEWGKGVDLRPITIIDAQEVYGLWKFADLDGNWYRPRTAPYDDYGPVRRLVRSRTVWNEARRFRVAKLEITGEFGRDAVENPTPDWLGDTHKMPLASRTLAGVENGYKGDHAAAPRLWARFSGDGKRWTPPKSRPLGLAGDYEARCTFNDQGQFRRFVTEISITDPVDVSINSDAVLEIAPNG